MTRSETIQFEIYIMDIAERCKTKKDFERLAEQLHDSVEIAIQDSCHDLGIDDYEPSY